MRIYIYIYIYVYIYIYTKFELKHSYILHKCKVGKLQVAEYDWTHPQTCHTYMNCHLKYLYRLIPFSDD